jgi:LmbE family N-acetylglucosaminyl deacetylase
MNFTPNFCIDVSDTIERKLQAVNCYSSQFTGNSALVPEMVKSVTAYFGTRIGTAHAEPFFTHEMLGFGGLDQLI